MIKLDPVWYIEEKEICRHIREELIDGYPDYTIIFGKVVTGSEDPEFLRREAEGWNDSIRESLKDAMEKIQTTDGTIMLDNELTFKLRIAANTADDTFHVHGSKAILLPDGCGFEVFHTVLDDETLISIVRHPDQWALVQVSLY